MSVSSRCRSTRVSSRVEWRPVPDWEAYEANAYGYIRNRSTGRRLRSYDTGERTQITLQRNGKTITRAVGIFILNAWVGPRPGVNYDCSHLDGNYANNRLSNLAWETRRRNMERRDEHGTTARGERSGAAKLTAANVETVRAELTGGASCAALARRFGVTAGAISHIKHGRSWRAPA